MSLSKFGQSSDASTQTLNLLSRGYEYTADGNIDAKNLKICNVQAPFMDNDAANKKYIDLAIGTLMKSSEELEQYIHNQNERMKNTVNTFDEINAVNQQTNERVLNLNNKIDVNDQAIKALSDKNAFYVTVNDQRISGLELRVDDSDRETDGLRLYIDNSLQTLEYNCNDKIKTIMRDVEASITKMTGDNNQLEMILKSMQTSDTEDQAI